MRTCDDCDQPPTTTLGGESIIFAACDNPAHVRRFESRCRRRAAKESRRRRAELAAATCEAWVYIEGGSGSMRVCSGLAVWRALWSNDFSGDGSRYLCDEHRNDWPKPSSALVGIWSVDAILRDAKSGRALLRVR